MSHVKKNLRFHWSSSFPMAQLKQSWQYWNSSVVKILLPSCSSDLMKSQSPMVDAKDFMSVYSVKE